jgi:hypothetical protein
MLQKIRHVVETGEFLPGSCPAASLIRQRPDVLCCTLNMTKNVSTDCFEGNRNVQLDGNFGFTGVRRIICIFICSDVAPNLFAFNTLCVTKASSVQSSAVLVRLHGLRAMIPPMSAL